MSIRLSLSLYFITTILQVPFSIFAQTHLDQQSVKTSVIDNLAADATQAKRYIVGSTIVDGNIESRKIKVTSDPGTFPDYVFSENYQLRTLSELERYIKEKGSLPDKEFEDNYQGLRNLQQSSSGRDEELTLYAMTQEKDLRQFQDWKEENKVMRQTLNDLNKRLETLEKKYK